MEPAERDESLFLTEAREIVERLHRDLDELRLGSTQGRRRRELAARLFRRIHSLKGSAGSLGYKSVSQVAHEFEGVLDGVRLGRLEINAPMLDTFEDAIHSVSGLLEATPATDPDPAAGAMAERLRALVARDRQPATGAISLRSTL